MKRILAVALALGACHATPPPAEPNPVAVAPAACNAQPAGTTMALMLVTSPANKPTLGDAATQLGIPVDALDCQFGVVAIDLRNGTYAVRVDASRVKGGDPAHGPFSDPEIAPTLVQR